MWRRHALPTSRGRREIGVPGISPLDRKGLYAKARAGVVKEFTGISDPYEEPDDSEVGIDTTETTPEEAAQEIMLHLEQAGYVGANAR